MSITLYHNPRCSKSRAALALLREAGYAPDIVEYLKTPYTAELLRALCQQSGLTPRCLLRANEPLAKTMKLAEKNGEDIIAALAAHPALVQRPILVTAKGAALGRPPENLRAILPD